MTMRRICVLEWPGVVISRWATCDFLAVFDADTGALDIRTTIAPQPAQMTGADRANFAALLARFEAEARERLQLRQAADPVSAEGGASTCDSADASPSHQTAHPRVEQ